MRWPCLAPSSASVWEWTSDAFAPYPGFEPGPYREYSQPWFGNQRELRGGAFATHARMHNPRYRNFFEPHRTDQAPSHVDDRAHTDNFYRHLQTQCAKRAPLFAPATEQAALIALVHDLLP